ncbi:MAG: class I SAM-dependent methyltransferase, partial [Ilumatobacter fluminis]
ASAAPEGVTVTAIVPHAGNDRGPQEIEGYADDAESDHARFNANLQRAGVADRVRHLRMFSDEALGEVAEIDVLYIDGAHRYGPALADIRQWGAKVRPGGTMLIHDSFSSIGVTGAIGRELLWSQRWRYVGRSRSLAIYRADTDVSSWKNAGRQLAQVPWFAKNVVLKVLISAKILRGREWPY